MLGVETIEVHWKNSMNQAVSRILSPVIRKSHRFQTSNYRRTLSPSGCSRCFSVSTKDDDLGPNPGLESVISQGIKSLEETAMQIEKNTRKKLHDSKKDGPTPRQEAERHRIMEIATDCLEDICMREGAKAKGLNLRGEPIVILDVEVNRDAKLAKVFWTLPYVVLLDQRVNQRLYQELVRTLDNDIVNGGGGKLLSRHVNARLRSYYPPRIKLLPATDYMVRQAIEEYLEE